MATSVIVKLPHRTQTKGATPFMSNSITQDMKYRQSLMKYADKYGVKCASRKYNKSRSYIYFWRKRWDGTEESLACQSRRPHSHPRQHTKEELELIRRMRRRNPNLGLTEQWYRLKQKGYSRTVESLYRCMRREGLIKPSMAQKKAPAKPYQKIARKGIKIECVQTDNGFEFTNRFSNSKRDIPTLFEAAELHIRHKRIKPYTPRHNGKVERSHREDQRLFYDTHFFHSLDGFGGQLAIPRCPQTDP